MIEGYAYVRNVPNAYARFSPFLKWMIQINCRLPNPRNDVAQNREFRVLGILRVSFGQVHGTGDAVPYRGYVGGGTEVVLSYDDG